MIESSRDRVTDCAAEPGKMLISTREHIDAIIRDNFGLPHTCGGTCYRAQREKESGVWPS